MGLVHNSIAGCGIVGWGFAYNSIGRRGIVSGRVPGSNGAVLGGGVGSAGVAGVRGHCGVTGSVEGGDHVTVGGEALGVAHLSRIPDFPLLLRQDHTHPRTTPTRSMARTALSTPSPPPSAVQSSSTAIGSVLSPELPPATPPEPSLPPPTLGSVLSPESLPPTLAHCGGVVSGSVPVRMFGGLGMAGVH